MRFEERESVGELDACHHWRHNGLDWAAVSDGILLVIKQPQVSLIRHSPTPPGVE